ncbi:hypothetical protein EEJ42_16315, partial [Streptomyces botrytidirepellens]
MVHGRPAFHARWACQPRAALRPPGEKLLGQSHATPPRRRVSLWHALRRSRSPQQRAAQVPHPPDPPGGGPRPWTGAALPSGRGPAGPALRRAGVHQRRTHRIRRAPGPGRGGRAAHAAPAPLR